MKQEKLTKFIASEDSEQKWYIIDATDKIVGRLAAKVARVVRGKEKPTFTPNADTGDFVVIINADKVKIASKRAEQKTYFHYSGYPGGAKFKSYADVTRTNPAFILNHAIKGMLPKTKLGNKLIKKVKIYAGEEHPHKAQKPEILSI